jgi:hypothetical protein
MPLRQESFGCRWNLGFAEVRTESSAGSPENWTSAMGAAMTLDRFWSVGKINDPNVLCYANPDCCPFRRQHVLAMAWRIDPFLQNELSASPC